MKKKLVAMLVIAVMALVMVTGCGNGSSNGDTVKIGIIQQMQHASLDEAYKGFVDGLEDAGYVEGENLEIDYQNASGEVSNCQSICDVFKTNNDDLVLAIATNAAQSAVSTFQETDTPVLFTAVTDPVDAGLVESLDAPGKMLRVHQIFL